MNTEIKSSLNEKYGKTATYQETDSMHEIKPCTLNNPNGAHNYTTLNQTTIYCTQCGDVKRIGGVAEKHIYLVSQAGSGHEEWLNEIAFTTQTAAEEYVAGLNGDIQNYYRIDSVILGN